MGKNKIYPELHDIGKVIDWEKIGEEIGDPDFKYYDHYFVYKGDEGSEEVKIYDFSKLDIAIPEQDLNWKGTIWHHNFGDLNSSYSGLLREDFFGNVPKIVGIKWEAKPLK